MDKEEMMIDFLLHYATDEQLDQFFGYAPHGFSREDIEDTLSQMPDDVFDELAEEFNLSANEVER